MGRAIPIERKEHSAEYLRVLARMVESGACRLLAISYVLDGYSRADAARLAGMDRQTLSDWIHRYNAEGVAGLADRARSGRPARLDAACVA